MTTISCLQQSFNNRRHIHRTIRNKPFLFLFVPLLALLFSVSSAYGNPVIEIQAGDGAKIEDGGYYLFPDTTTDTFLARGFTVYNKGTSQLNIYNPDAVLAQCSFFAQHPNVILAPAISPGEKSAFRIQFQASTPGAFSCEVTLQTNDAAHGNFRFTLHATASAPPVPMVRVVAGDGMEVQPGSVYSLSPTTVNTATSRAFTIYNDGSAPLSIANPTSLVSGNWFSQTPSPVPAASVEPGTSTVFRVRLLSSVAGAFTGGVSIQTNDPQKGTFIFNVQGTVQEATAPRMRLVVGDGTELSNGSTYVFPDTPANIAVSRGFTVLNEGTAALQIQNPTSLVTGNCFTQIESVVLASTIEPQSQSAFRIRLLSASAASCTATVSIQSNDPQNNPFTFAITGNVIGTQSAIRIVSGDGTDIKPGDTYSLPSIALNTFIARGFTVHNVGAGTLTISNPNSVVNGAGFTQHPNVILQSSIAPNTQSAFRVQFQAATAGTYIADVNIASNDPVNPNFAYRIKIEVKGPSFEIDCPPNAGVLTTGGSKTFRVGIKPMFGFNTAVSMSVTGLPAGVTAFFAQNSILPGESSNFTLNAASNATNGTYTFVINGSGGGVERSVPVRVEVAPPGVKPEIHELESDPIIMIPEGQSSPITLRGKNLTGGTASVGTTKNNPEDPDRVFPTATVEYISPEGNEMRVRVDATAAGITGYYALYVETPGGKTGTFFRVIPDGPVVDYWTPSQVAGDTTFAMDLIGVNLQGASVSASSSAVEILELDNSADDVLSGYIRVRDDVKPGLLFLTVHGKSGAETYVNIDAQTSRPDITRPTKAMFADDGSVIFYSQDWNVSSELVSSPKNFSLCVEVNSRRNKGKRWTRTVFQRKGSKEWEFTLERILSQAIPGVTLSIRTQTFVRWISATLTLDGGFCLSTNEPFEYDFQLCATITTGFQVPGLAGVTATFFACYDQTGGDGGIDIAGEGLLSFIQFHRRTSTTPSTGGTEPLGCTSFTDLNPSSQLGEREFNVTINQCCTENIGVAYTVLGTRAGDFDIGSQPAGTVTPQDPSCFDGFKVKEVTFSGDFFTPVLKDDGSGAYSSPHWQDNSSPPDGDAVDSGDRQFPISYLRNRQILVSPKFFSGKPYSGPVPKIRAQTSVDGLSIPETTMILDAGTTDTILYVGQPILSQGRLPDWIDRIDFKIMWEVSTDAGQTWIPAGESTNRIYVTLYQPVNKNTAFHTLLDIGCRNAARATEDDQAVDKIWSDFLDPAGASSESGVSRVDGERLWYWKENVPECKTFGQLLRTGDGTCQAWAEFLHETIRAQGIRASRILETLPIDTGEEDGRATLLVQNWTFIGAGSAPSACRTDGYTHRFLDTEIIDNTGRAGQGLNNNNPRSRFNNHFIVEYKRANGIEQLYDPSYGSGPHGNSPDIREAQQLWENDSIAGFVRKCPSTGEFVARKIDRTRTNFFYITKESSGDFQTINLSPTAVTDEVTVSSGSSVTVSVLSNDFDPDGDLVTIVSSTQPAHGSVSWDAGTAVYTAHASYRGTDSFSYTISDTWGMQASALVNVTIPNQAPTPRTEILAAREDLSVGYFAYNVLSNDSDPDGDELRITKIEQPANGTFTLAPNNTQFTYRAKANWSGMDSFYYTVSDPYGAEVRVLSQISVSAVNDAPVANPDTFSVYKNQLLTITQAQVVANDTDIEKDTISIYSVGAATHGTTQKLASGSIEYRPYSGYVGTDSFEYIAADSTGGAYGTGRITVNVLQDQVPVPNFTVSCSGRVCTFDASSSTDDRGIVVYSWILYGPNSAAAGKTFTYTYPFAGVFQARLTVEDTLGQQAAVTKWVTVTEPPPVANDDSFTWRKGYSRWIPYSSMLANDTDPSNDVLTVQSVDNSNIGDALSCDSEGCVFSPGPYWIGQTWFTYTVSDGHGQTDVATVTLTFTY